MEISLETLIRSGTVAGPQGLQGIQGPQSVQGLQGIQGLQGGGADIFTTLIGDGVNTAYTITHNLDATSTFFEVKNIASDSIVYPDINTPTTNTATITFSIVPSVDSYRVSVFGA